MSDSHFLKFLEELEQQTVGRCFKIRTRKQAIRVLDRIPHPSKRRATEIISRYRVEDLSTGVQFECAEDLLGDELTEMEAIAWAAKK